MSEDREDLIKRIIEEKGESAIPALINLLYDEDPEVKEIVAEALYRMQDSAREALYQELLKRWREGIEEDDVSILYIVDLLGDMGEERAKDIFYSLLSKYTVEEAVLVIYEALAKLGEGEKILSVLEYMLLEDSYRDKYGDQVAMVLSYIDSPKAVEILKKAYFDEKLPKEVKEFVLRALRNLIDRNPTFITRIGRDILKDMEKIEWS